MLFRFGYLITVVMVGFTVLVGCSSAPDNIVVDADMMEIYRTDGECIDISPDSQFLFVPTGIVDLETGNILLETTPLARRNSARFAREGRFTAVLPHIRFGSDRLVYDLQTGELLDLPDGQLIDFGRGYVAADDGLYDAETGELIFDVPRDNIEVGLLGDYMAIAGDGVYFGTLENQLFELPDGEVTLYARSSCGRCEPALAHVQGVGIFRIPDGEQIIAIDNDAQFTITGGLIHVFEDAFYDLETGDTLPFYPESLMSMTTQPSPQFTVSSNNEWIAVWGDGVFSLETGEQVLALSDPEQRTIFGDGTYVAVEGDAIYSTVDGEVVVTIEGSPMSFAQTSIGDVLLVDGEGVYLLPEGNLFVPLETSVRIGLNDFRFVNDDNWLILRGIGGYNLETGDKLFDVPTSISVPPSNDALIVADVGVFNFADGSMRYSLVDSGGSPTLPANYGANGDIMWVLGDGVYDFVDGTRLLVTEDERDTIHLHSTEPIIAYTANELTSEATCTVYRYDG